MCGRGVDFCLRRNDGFAVCSKRIGTKRRSLVALYSAVCPASEKTHEETARLSLSQFVSLTSRSAALLGISPSTTEASDVASAMPTCTISGRPGQRVDWLWITRHSSWSEPRLSILPEQNRITLPGLSAASRKRLDKRLNT